MWPSDWRDEDERADPWLTRMFRRLFRRDPKPPAPITRKPMAMPVHIGPLTEAQADKVLRGVFGDRVQRCVGCNGVGRTDETCDVYGRHDAVRIDMSCPVCGSKGLMNVVEVAA